ncbi:TPA: hypothetical protein R8G72_004633 [Citrobacter youngae]|uniref:DUF6037 family protein n=1 Tax=unclassified Citrobacter TaxID=2644389 RepID=UPI0010CA1033|nr:MULTISPECIES: DUF6037 family protein [unclassified Citrobacter]HEE0140625.1 hypothetical protein [Citrobacter youngae]MBJ8889988.1 hypothetical protein [Citrobacter sp. FDAARGOS_156]MBJ9201454.1 hypothetical protein [Citrobacter sp. FDAARGOS_156]TKU15890.1 hypothetical protein FDX03_15375 [Citrobacter sp. wls827]TKU39155.1 hypothetical protein FDX24_16095 [Citrobacter sp. wls716]
MIVNQLKTLHKNMLTQGITRTQFQYMHNHLTFDVLFIAEENFELLFGAVGHNCSFFVKVQKGYDLVPIIRPESAFLCLIKLLKLTSDPTNRFSAKAFFQDFALKIPETVKARNSTLPSSLTPEIDEADKVVFLGWRNNGESGGHVTEPNLRKTLNAFGKDIHEFCKIRNISSRWSPKKDK